MNDQRALEYRDALFSHTVNLLFIIGFDGYLRRWNPAWKATVGYDHDEIMAIPLRELSHPDDRERIAKVGQKIRSGESVYGVEARIRCKDGSYRWLLWNAVPCVEQQVYFATLQDITLHKEVEDQLAQSQERFQLIASATKDAVWDWDLRSNHVWRNDAFLQSFGAPHDGEDLLAWWEERIHPSDRTRILAKVPPPTVDGRQQWAFEYRLRRMDGIYAHVYDRGFTIYGSDGQPARMVGSLMDITALKTVEDQLRESDERFRLAAKATHDAIWDWDLRKSEVWRSEGFQTLFGYSAEETKGDFEWWLEHIHPLDRKRVLAQIPPLSSSGTHQCTFEYRFRRSDGTYADVFDRGFVISDPDGKPVRMVGSLMDVSERRRAEEVAHMHRAELAHIARVSTMGEIATGLAHELNQPLTAIANYAESCKQAMAAKTPARDEQLLEWIEKISASTQRAAQMIRRLRGFTRKSDLRRSTVEINELIQEVIELLETETRHQNVRVRWEPAAATHATVDRVQIQQVLVNLLQNAYESMGSSAPDQRQVTISAGKNSDRIEVAVEDQGEGISPENRDRVFDAFFTSKPHGVGIGLAISRSIVEAHGGRLWLEPNTARGVTFRFTLPVSGA